MTVRTQRDGPVVTVTLDRPAKLNAVTDEMWSGLQEVLGEIQRDPGSRVLVLTGAGGTFCAGSDVTGLLAEPSSLPDRIRLMNRVLVTLHELAIPTICQVEGVAAGSGVSLALLCDFVLASESASFSELFVRRGLSLDSGASWLLPRLAGERRARELAILGDTIDAQTALADGLISGVHPAAQLAAAVAGLAARLAVLPPDAVAGTKRLLARSWDRTLAQAPEAETVNQLAVIASPAAQAAISGFRRPGSERARA